MKLRAWAFGAFGLAIAAAAAFGQPRAPVSTVDPGPAAALAGLDDAIRQEAPPPPQPAPAAAPAPSPERRVRVILSSPYGSSEP